MQIFSVGPDEMSEYNFDRLNPYAFEWFVYAYQIGYYSGNGEAVALRKEDGLLAYGGLGHCSCYGPIDDDWTGANTCTVDEYLSMSSDYIFDDVPSDAVKSKVRELLGLGG